MTDEEKLMPNLDDTLLRFQNFIWHMQVDADRMLQAAETLAILTREMQE